jgi:hypothetical protein
MEDHELRPLSNAQQRRESVELLLSHSEQWAQGAISECSIVSGKCTLQTSPSPSPGERLVPARQEQPSPIREIQDSTLFPAFSNPARRILASTPGDASYFSVAQEEQPNASSLQPCTWLPVTLRRPYLLAIFTISLLLGAVLLFLTAYSATNNGLGTDNSSFVLLFGWRFCPTLFAVAYTILVGTILIDCRRTEVFARLSNEEGASSSSTLCFPARAWWNDPIDALSSKKNNGKRSWALFLVSFVNILGFLVISPLSAALLVPVNIDIPRDTGFRQLKSPSKYALQVDTGDSIMFRSFSGSLLNTSTSVWISNDYFVLPFWPSGLRSAPLAAQFSASQYPEQWIAHTTAYKAMLNCSDVSLKEMHKNDTSSDALGLIGPRGEKLSYRSMATFKLSSEDGCLINIYQDNNLRYSIAQEQNLALGGGWWARSPDQIASLLGSRDHNRIYFFSNSTGNCGNRSFIAYNAPWNVNQSLPIKGHLCSSTYLEADLSVTVTITDAATKVSFDHVQFTKNQKPMDSARYSLSQLEDFFFSSNWSTKLTEGVSQSFLGPLLAIASTSGFDNDGEKMFASNSVVDIARRFQQQSFGQMIYTGLVLDGPESASAMSGQIRVTERRIVVVFGIGLTLGLLFLLSSVCIVGVAFYTRLSRRPLNLHCDPGSIAVAASLITSDASVRTTFEGFDRLPMSSIKERLRHLVYSMREGMLLVHETKVMGMIFNCSRISPILMHEFRRTLKAV